MLRVVGGSIANAYDSGAIASHEPGRCVSCPARVACIAAHLDSAKRRLLPEYFHTAEPYHAGDYIYRAGDAADARYHVRSGMFKTYAINAEGDEYVTGIYLPGDILGHTQEHGQHAETAVALETASVCVFSEQSIGRCTEPEINVMLLRQIGEQALRGTLHQLNLKQTSAQARFAGFCLLFSRRLVALGRCGSHLPTPMSRTDIASYLGMTLESLSRVISKLNQMGVIRATRRHIEILQPEALQALGLHVS